MRLHWWQSMGEGTRRQQDDRGGGFLAMWEWRQELFLWCACTWRWAQDSGACACACCDHICTAERLFSAAVWMRHAYYWPALQRFWGCCLLFPSYITSARLFFFLPGLYFTASPVPGEQLSCIQHGFSSNSSLLLQNLNKIKFCGEKNNDLGQHKTETWKKKSQTGYWWHEVMWCDVMLCLYCLPAIASLSSCFGSS